MGSKIENKDIHRVALDSHPVSSTLKLNSVPVDLTGWLTYLYYTEVQEDGTLISVRITGVNSTNKKGATKFYPREMYCDNITNTVAYRGLAVAGRHTYSIVRNKIAYEQNDAGDWVLIDGEYIVYDVGNTEHDGLQRYSEYTETMTHAIGDIIVSNRAGL